MRTVSTWRVAVPGVPESSLPSISFLHHYSPLLLRILFVAHSQPVQSFFLLLVLHTTRLQTLKNDQSQMSGPPPPPLPPPPTGNNGPITSFPGYPASPPPPAPSPLPPQQPPQPSQPAASPPAAAAPIRLSNHYLRRLIAEPGKSCFVCSRPTTVVLVSTTAGAEDFFYACATHLSDRNFATSVQGPGSTSSSSGSTASGAAGGTDSDRLPDKVGKDEIEKVKREYEERQKAKKEAEAKQKKEAADADDKKGDEKGEGKDGQKDKKSQGWLSYLTSSLSDSTSSSPAGPKTNSSGSSTPTAAAPPAQPTGPLYYSLHRSFYAMRIDAYNKRQAMKRAKELNFPSVPK